MSELKFFKPESISQATQFLSSEPDSMPVAGGTDFVVKVRNGLFPQLKSMVDISSLPLKEITENDKDIVIGSGCTMTQVTISPIVKKYFPALSEAASTVGALQIRNLATLGGNTANASPAGDTIPALCSIEAQLKLNGPEGTRMVPIEDFFTGPGKTILKKAELIEAFILPKHESKGAFLKLGERKAHAIAKINLAISVWQENTATRCRIAMGSVAPTVIRVSSVEKLIESNGLPLSEENLQTAIKLASEAARPISDVRSTRAYRKQMAGVLMKRAIERIS
jgi:CO/xanthine dehydrogenase FAD-binding subunit